MAELLLYKGGTIGYYIEDDVGESIVLVGDTCEFTMLNGELMFGKVNVVVPENSLLFVAKGLPPAVLYEDSLVVNGHLISLYSIGNIRTIKRGRHHKLFSVYVGKVEWKNGGD